MLTLKKKDKQSLIYRLRQTLEPLEKLNKELKKLDLRKLDLLRKLQ